MMWDLVLLLAAAGCCCRADAALASTSTTPRPCVGAADIDPTGRQPGMVGAVRLSHLGPGLMGVTFSTPNHTLSITPRYRAIVHWGTRPDKLDHNSTTSPIDVDKAEVGAVHRCNGVNPAPPGAVQGPWEHYLAMDGLVDNQTYYYRVGDAGEYGLSSVRRFRSAPAVDGDATTLSLVLSDMGEFNWSASTVNRLVAMAESDEYDLLMHNGDISYADNRLHINEGTQYIDDMNSFFANISCFSALRPYMMTVGNHEAYCSYIEYIVRALNQPWNQSESSNLFYYSMDYGNVHWIALANEHSSTMMDNPNTTEFRWLEADLQKAAAARARGEISWIFTVLHYPTMASNVKSPGGYCTSLPHTYSCVVNCTQDPTSLHFEDLLYKYGVDIMFTGHSHQYERTTPVFRYENQSASSDSFVDPAHTIFVNTGSAGNVEVESGWLEPRPPWSVGLRGGPFQFGFGEVRAEGRGRLSFVYRESATGDVIDRFEIVRSGPHPSLSALDLASKGGATQRTGPRLAAREDRKSMNDETVPHSSSLDPIKHQSELGSDACPPDHRVLWNGLCQPTLEWPPNRPLSRAVVTPAYLKTKPAHINVSIGRQLFVDSFLVQSSANIQTVYHAPQYADMSVNPVLRSTASWEVGETAGGLAGTAKAVGVCDDAIVWSKPMLNNGFKSCGGAACNMVVETGGIGNSAVWLDLDTSNSSRRYVLAASHSRIDFYTSANGTKFNYEGSSSNVEDCTTIYKDVLRNKWVYSIKASGPKSSPGRTRRYWEGHDVLADCHWGSISGNAPVKPGCPVQWLGSDVLDDPNLACGYTPSLDANNTQLYQFDGVAYESIVIGLFSIITGKRCSPPRPFHRGGEQDAVYVGWSRDGFHFQRSPVRSTAFLPMGTKLHSWNFQNVRAVAGGFLTSAEQLRFFVEGKSGSCDGLPSCNPKLGSLDGNTTTGTATMRRDGFASIEIRNKSAAGVLTTEPLTFAAPGSTTDTFLFINVYIAQAGTLQAELLIDGKSTLSSVAIRGEINSTMLKVSWRDDLVTDTAAGNTAFDSIGEWPPPTQKPQLRFTLTGQVQLYAFWLTRDARCGSSNGPVAGGGRGFSGGWNRYNETAPCPIIYR